MDPGWKKKKTRLENESPTAPMSNIAAEIRKSSIERKLGGRHSNIAVSIERQSSRYNMVPAHLDYTERYQGSVGKLQQDVEGRRITIPSSGHA